MSERGGWLEAVHIDGHPAFTMATVLSISTFIPGREIGGMLASLLGTLEVGG